MNRQFKAPIVRAAFGDDGGRPGFPPLHPPPVLARSAGLFLTTLALGWIEYLMGHEISLSIFYLGPIALGAWRLGRGPGVFLSLLSVSLWLAVDLLEGPVYSHPLIPFWNAGVHLAFFLIAAHLISGNREQAERVARMAMEDALTGLLNGRGFGAEARRLLDLAARHGHPLVILYIDIDNFKEVNDTLGHAAGDTLLRRIGEALQQGMRSSDVLGRLGGDEFAVLLPETDASGARAGAIKIQDRLRTLFRDEGWPVTASIGAVVLLAVPEDVDQALRLADACMYRVKNGGKDGFFLLEWKG